MVAVVMLQGGVDSRERDVGGTWHRADRLRRDLRRTGSERRSQRWMVRFLQAEWGSKPVEEG